MKILVHYDANQGQAYGVWWDDPYTGIESLYLDPKSAQASRGRTVMYGKSNEDVSWDAWFDTLVERAPYFESWVAWDSMGMAPDQFLHAITAKAAS